MLCHLPEFPGYSRNKGAGYDCTSTSKEGMEAWRQSTLDPPGKAVSGCWETRKDGWVHICRMKKKKLPSWEIKSELQEDIADLLGPMLQCPPSRLPFLQRPIIRDPKSSPLGAKRGWNGPVSLHPWIQKTSQQQLERGETDSATGPAPGVLAGLSQWSINQEQDSIGNMQLGFRILCFALLLVLSNSEFLGLVAAWHPSYLGGRGRRISSSNPVWARVSSRPA